MKLLPLPYRTGSMWVWSSGWNDDVMATPLVKSASGRKVRAPRMASLFVRVSSQAGREVGERGVPESMQELLRAQCARGEHDDRR